MASNAQKKVIHTAEGKTYLVASIQCVQLLTFIRVNSNNNFLLLETAAFCVIVSSSFNLMEQIKLTVVDV